MKIVFTDEAVLNLQSIQSYLRERNPAAAATIGRAIRKSAEMHPKQRRRLRDE